MVVKRVVSLPAPFPDRQEPQLTIVCERIVFDAEHNRVEFLSYDVLITECHTPRKTIDTDQVSRDLAWKGRFEAAY